MIEALKRNTPLVAILVIVVGVFFGITLPAQERAEALGEMERAKRQELHALQEEGSRSADLARALREGDQLQYDREIQRRFLIWLRRAVAGSLYNASSGDPR